MKTKSLPRYLKLLRAGMLAALAFGLAGLGWGQTAGPRDAGTGSTSGTGNAWSNPTNINGNDNSYAIVTVSTSSWFTQINATSQILSSTQYGFNIPSNATIDGIQVTIGRYANGTSIQDNTVRLIKEGALVGNNLALSSTNWQTTETAQSYGANNNLWGTTWTPEEINSSNFGVALVTDISFYSFFGDSRTAYVDYMQITVYYTLPSATTTLAANTASAASVCFSETRVPIQSFTLTQAGSNVNLTGLTFTTTGTYAAADITKFQLYTFGSDDLASAVQVGSDITATLGPGSHSFGTISQALTASATRYFWITMDVDAEPTDAVTLAVSALGTTNFTVDAGTKSGSANAGGTQTIYYPTFTYTKNDVTCFDAGDGEIFITPSGGSGGYEYQYRYRPDPGSSWSLWSGWTSISTALNNLAAGDYEIEVQDSNGCVQTECTEPLP